MNESMSSEHERTEPASQFKLSEARKQGQVAKSLDVNSFVMIFVFVAMLSVSAHKAWDSINQFSVVLLTNIGDVTNSSSALHAFQFTVSTLWSVLLTPICAGVVAAILANILQTGPVFSFSPLKPKFERLNPVAGFKRLFTKRLLVESAKSTFKLAVLVIVVYVTFSAHWRELADISVMPVADQIGWFCSVATMLLFRLVFALFVFALIDLALARLQFAKQMRMSRRDIKEEVKRREGDPLIRSKIRQLQRENLKQSKSLNRVADADVLITNPIHFAVALKYVRGEMSAPVVIAKGSERWAADMRMIANKHSIPTFERRSLARQLFRRAVIDRPVPAEAFIDVARVYADLNTHRRSQADRLEASA